MRVGRGGRCGAHKSIDEPGQPIYFHVLGERICLWVGEIEQFLLALVGDDVSDRVSHCFGEGSHGEEAAELSNGPPVKEHRVDRYMLKNRTRRACKC